MCIRDSAYALMAQAGARLQALPHPYQLKELYEPVSYTHLTMTARAQIREERK